MTGDVMGGGVVVAIAATLWLAYLVPVLFRRREYLATERNAVRLQQTLRILAETSELPEQVRMEATARTVAEQQRILRRAEERRLAEARAAAAAHARREQAIAEEERRAAEEAERAATAAIAVERAARAAAAQRARVLAADTASKASSLSPLRRRRLRRSRAVSAVVLLAGLLGSAVGVGMLLTTGSWLLLAGSVAAGAASIGMLVRLAQPRAVGATAPAMAHSPLPQSLYDDAQHDARVEEPRKQQETWTPRPLPKPLHLSRGTIAASAMASMDAATELRRAAARAELERTAADQRPEPAQLRPVAVATADPAPSRYAAMGIVGSVDDGAIDLDAVLRRRRAAS